MKRQIIAMGGGGFSGSESLSLDRYILEQTGQSRPKVCFVPTASGDAESYVLRFYQAMASLDCRPSFLSLFRLPTADLESFIMDKNVIYVGGGNTRSMLALWREWGLDNILRQAYQAGVVLAGISAGANCWFEQCSTDSMPGPFQMWPCLGFLAGSFCPHYDAEVERRPSLQRMLQTGEIKPGLAAENNTAVHFVDEQLLQAVSATSTARVYRVTLVEGLVQEIPLDMCRLV